MWRQFLALLGRLLRNTPDRCLSDFYSSSLMLIPDSFPEKTTDAMTLSFVLFQHSHLRGKFTRAPRRELQRKTSRKSGGSTSASLRRLVAQRWLEVDRRHAANIAHCYLPGERFVSGEACLLQWEKFSRAIWSADSVLAPVLKKSLCSHGSLNFSGILVFAYFVLHPNRIIEISEVARSLSTVVSRGTVDNRIARLVDRQLVERVGRGRWRLNPEWESVVEGDGFAEWEKNRANRIEMVTRAETERFQQLFRRGGLTSHQRARLLVGKRCAFCGNHRQVEAHEYPPDTWRPVDLEASWFALCRKCNALESRFYQLHPRENYDWLEALSTESKLRISTIQSLRERYAVAINEALKTKNFKKAESIAARTNLLMRLENYPRTPNA